MGRRKEIETALNTPDALLTSRQYTIRSVYAELNSEENQGKMSREILEKQMVSVMRSRKRGLITQGEYRERVQVIELFYL